MIIPSYEHYGTHDDSAYPELWEGCVGAWAPCLAFGEPKLVDLSGYGNHATFNNGALLNSQWGMTKEAIGYKFNASDSQYATAADKLQLQLGAGDFTMAARFVIFTFPNSSSVQRTILSKHYTGYEMYGFNGNGPDNQSGTFHTYIGNGSAYTGYPTTVESNLPAQAGRQYLGFGVRKGGQYYAGLDRVLFGPNSNTYDISKSGTDLEIGRRAGTTQYMDGLISEVLLFNRALSFDELFLLVDIPGAMFYPRRPRRFYSFADVSNRRRRFLLGAAA